MSIGDCRYDNVEETPPGFALYTHPPMPFTSEAGVLEEIGSKLANRLVPGGIEVLAFYSTRISFATCEDNLVLRQLRLLACLPCR